MISQFSPPLSSCTCMCTCTFRTKKRSLCCLYQFYVFSNVFLVFWFFFLSQKVGITCTNQLFFLECECEKDWVNENGVHFFSNALFWVFFILIQIVTQNWHQLTLTMSTPWYFVLAKRHSASLICFCSVWIEIYWPHHHYNSFLFL